jgi:hypothetical protein
MRIRLPSMTATTSSLPNMAAHGFQRCVGVFFDLGDAGRGLPVTSQGRT